MSASPLLDRPSGAAPHLGPTCLPQRTRRRRRIVVALLVAGLTGGAAIVATLGYVRGSDAHRSYLGGDGWPLEGQAATRIGRQVRVGPRQSPVPIASLAKVMTAYVVLQANPLDVNADGPVLTVNGFDVRDTARRRAEDQSVITVRRGERLTERQALAAILLPSANNVAAMLARRVAGSTTEFVARMNATARRLGMTQTIYTDPSGYDAATVSTARDQVLLAVAVSGNETFGDLVATASYRLPVVGVVHNTDSLLGRDGFVGMKTGSDDAAGGCFMFHTWRLVDGRVTEVLGVVLGQHGRHLVTAGLYAARQIADRLGPAAKV